MHASNPSAFIAAMRCIACGGTFHVSGGAVNVMFVALAETLGQPLWGEP